MAYTPLRDIPKKVAKLEDFDGNSVRGVYFEGGVKHPIHRGQAEVGPPAGSIYIVWSYLTPIAWIDGLGKAVRPAQKFSRTTTRHQSTLYTLKDLTEDERDKHLTPLAIIKENPFS